MFLYSTMSLIFWAAKSNACNLSGSRHRLRRRQLRISQEGLWNFTGCGDLVHQHDTILGMNFWSVRTLWRKRLAAGLQFLFPLFGIPEGLTLVKLFYIYAHKKTLVCIIRKIMETRKVAQFVIWDPQLLKQEDHKLQTCLDYAVVACSGCVTHETLSQNTQVQKGLGVEINRQWRGLTGENDFTSCSSHLWGVTPTSLSPLHSLL